MYYKIIRNDMVKGKFITLITVVFVAAAAMLVSLAAILLVNLSGAIDTLMEKAQTSHFMQMHAGDIDMESLSSFAKQNENVEKFQVLSFLNVEGSKIQIKDQSLASSVQDNGFSTQSRLFDYLLDLDNQIIQVKDGEIYVPISYAKDTNSKVGDLVAVGTMQFQIAGFLRDSQMNSLLASSKRFLVSEGDFEKIKDRGKIEYLIEFRLKDASLLSDFESNYTKAGLNANGPTLTYPLFKMLNAISDGMMIGVLLLVSIMVVCIAFLCIRFTLLTKIEEDYLEIGVMKAIGLRAFDIKKIYLLKYAFITAIGCVIGYVLSVLFRGILLKNIRLYMGESNHSSLAALLGILGVFLVFVLMLSYVNRVLRRFRTISAAKAIRFGTSLQENGSHKKETFFLLSKNRFLDTNVFLGIKDVLSRKKLYFTMLMVFVLSAFIILVPQNLYNTIAKKDFSTYMGIGASDMRFDIRQTQSMEKVITKLVQELERDKEIKAFSILTTKTFLVQTDNHQSQRIKIELGDHRVFPIQYITGKAPVKKNEIALSILNAKELSKRVGDRLTLIVQGEEQDFTVCGIYSDITNGGKTAKAAFSDASAETMWCVIYTKLEDSSLAASKASQYEVLSTDVKVSDMNEYMIQTFGPTVQSIKTISYVALFIALFITFLITLLFMKMLIAKERSSIATLKVLGFTSKDIKNQFMARAIFVAFIGIILGTILANTLGEAIAGVVIAQLGAASFQFRINPITAYILSPLMMICLVLIAAMFSTAKVEQINITQIRKE